MQGVQKSPELDGEAGLGLNQARASQAHIGSMPSSGSAAVAMAARRLISEHAWYWLAAGHLMRLADLQRALSTVPCSLAALMQVPHIICFVGVSAYCTYFGWQIAISLGSAVALH